MQERIIVKLNVRAGRVLKTQLSEQIGCNTKALRQDLLALCSVCDISAAIYVGNYDGKQHSIPLELAVRLLRHLYGDSIDMQYYH